MRPIFLLVALGCAGPPSTADAPLVYVGEVDDAEAGTSIALAVARDRVVVYGCGDDPFDEEYLGWTGASLAAGQSEVRIDQGDWILEGSWDGDEATGAIVAADGTPYAWWARAVPAGQLDGLYVRRSRCMTAVIVDGSIVRGAWWCDGGELAQVTPLSPLELVDGHLAVEVRLETETRQVEVWPVRSPLP